MLLIYSRQLYDKFNNMFAVSMPSDSNGKETNQTIADTTNATYLVTPPFEMALPPLLLVGSEAANVPRVKQKDRWRFIGKLARQNLRATKVCLGFSCITKSSSTISFDGRIVIRTLSVVHLRSDVLLRSEDGRH